MSDSEKLRDEILKIVELHQPIKSKDIWEMVQIQKFYDLDQFYDAMTYLIDIKKIKINRDFTIEILEKE